MVSSELLQIISLGESSTVQFKERVDDAYKLGTELVALCNSRGGMLLVGVNDKTGDIHGLSFQELQFTTNLLANVASENVKPSIVIDTETVATDYGNVLVATVKEGLDKPYKDNKGIVWIKNASDKRKVFANSELASIMQSCGMLSADTRPVEKCTLSDLDPSVLKRFFMSRFSDFFIGMSYNDREDISLEAVVSKIAPGMNVEQLLSNLELINDNGQYTLGALLLFGKHPRRFNTLLTVLCVSFVGNTVASSTFRDKVLDIDGCLALQYEQAIAFIKRNLRNIQVQEGFNTLPELEIPLIVFVELLVNALIHRDYFRQSAIRLFIFDDRIEIHSPGCLPVSMSEDDLRKGLSKPRNHKLFDYARDAGLPYTGVGSGYIRAFSAYPHIEMKDDVSINEFVVTIKRPSLESNHYADIPENVIDHVRNDRDDDRDDARDDVLLLNEQKAVLAFCNTPHTSRDILRHVNVAYHPDALKLYIRALVNNGCLQMTMPDKPTSKNQHYFTTKKGKRLLSKKD